MEIQEHTTGTVIVLELRGRLTLEYFGRLKDRVRDLVEQGGRRLVLDLSGVSYVDDFEGSENAYTALRFTDGWRIAAPPEDAGPEGSRDGAAQEADVTDPILRSNWRGLFTWYTLTESVYRGFNQILSPATEPIPAVELFPERPYTSSREEDLPLDLLDLYFDPTRRGPYNFNRTVTGGEFVQQPEVLALQPRTARCWRIASIRRPSVRDLAPPIKQWILNTKRSAGK